MNAIYPTKECHYLPQLGGELLCAVCADEKRLEAVPAIPTFDKEQVFERDAAIGEIQ